MAKPSVWKAGVVVACVLTAMLTGCSSRNPEVKKRKYFESGQSYYQKGKYAEAAIQFENAIQVDPRFAEAHYELAQADMKLMRWPDAFQQLQRTLEIKPDHYAAHLDIANLLLTSRSPQLQEAKEHLDLLLQKQPDNALVYVSQANYLAESNNLGAALAAMQKALQLDPNRPETYLNQALLQMQGQLWDAAEGSFRKAVELDPKSTNAIVSLGKFYQVRERFGEAEQQYRSAIQIAPDDPAPRLSLARLYIAENKISEAEQFLIQSKKDFPDNPIGYRLLGDFYMANGQIDRALTEFSSLYHDHPQDVAVKRTYIQALILKDRLSEAQKLNDEILKAIPDDSEALICKGQIETRNNKASSAITTLQNVLKNEPANPAAHYQLGLAFDQAGNTSQAEAEWRQAVALQPDLSTAHRALAGAAIARSDANALAQEADQIISLEPGSPDGYLLRAVADIDRKQFASAEDFINRSLAKAPNNAAAYVQLGNLRVVQGRQADAQKAFQKALDLDPNSADGLGGVLNVYLTQKQVDKAIAVAQDQLRKYPQNVGFHIIMGRLLFEQKNDAAGAEAEFKQAAALDKNNTEALLSLGLVQNAQGKTDQALQTYLDAAKNNAKEVAFLLFAGGIYENKKDWDHAKQVYQRVLELRPEDPIASNNLAYVMLQQGGNVDVALAMAQTARRRRPDLASTADTLGWAYYHKGVYNSAIDLFKQAVKTEPDNATYNYHLGLAYAKNGQAAPARQQLDRLQRIRPGSDEIEELKRALEQMKS
ncbi:MAG TPA: tetratricopeptide repeat protein [Terriglobales bacterium]|nr:tetratricopeptide repeat protein [Terriglobales bacterium]